MKCHVCKLLCALRHPPHHHKPTVSPCTCAWIHTCLMPISTHMLCSQVSESWHGSWGHAPCAWGLFGLECDGLHSAGMHYYELSYGPFACNILPLPPTTVIKRLHHVHEEMYGPKMQDRWQDDHNGRLAGPKYAVSSWSIHPRPNRATHDHVRLIIIPSYAPTET